MDLAAGCAYVRLKPFKDLDRNPHNLSEDIYIWCQETAKLTKQALT